METLYEQPEGQRDKRKTDVLVRRAIKKREKTVGFNLYKIHRGPPQSSAVFF